MTADPRSVEIPLGWIPPTVTAIYGAIGVAIAGLLAWIAARPPDGANPVGFVVAVVVLAVGAFALSTGVRRLRDRRPGLRLDARGIDDNSRAFRPAFIAWDQIEGFGIAYVGYTAYVYAELRERPGANYSLLSEFLLWRGGRRKPINATNLAMAARDLKALLERHLALHRAGGG